jgi:hypothetical protein
MMEISCQKTIPIWMWPTEFTTKWIQRGGERCSNILHTAQNNNCHTIFIPLDLPSPQRLQRKSSEAIQSCMMMMMMCRKLWYSCLSSSPRILCSWDTLTCASASPAYMHVEIFSISISTPMSRLQQVSNVHASCVGFL